MRLDFLLLADSVDPGEAGKLTIRGAEVTRVSSHVVPFTVARLAAVAGFLLDEPDLGQPPVVLVKGWHEDGSPWFETEPIPVPEQLVDPRSRPAGEEIRLSLVVQLDGLRFDRMGPHTIDVEINGEKVGSRSLAVVVEPGIVDEPS